MGLAIYIGPLTPLRDLYCALPPSCSQASIHLRAKPLAISASGEVDVHA